MDKEQLHKKRQQKLKSQVDEKINKANIIKGLVILITGNGKGKTTSAFGTLARALGHKKKSSVAQFIKGTWECGEQNLFEMHNVDFHTMDSNFTWESQDKASDIIKAQKIWKKCKEMQENIFLRNVKYYFFSAYENFLEQNNKEFEKHIYLMHESIESNNDFIGIDNNTKNFFKAYSNNIAEYYFEIEFREGLEYLLDYDIDNKEIYQKFINILP